MNELDLHNIHKWRCGGWLDINQFEFWNFLVSFVLCTNTDKVCVQPNLNSYYIEISSVEHCVGADTSSQQQPLIHLSYSACSASKYIAHIVYTRSAKQNEIVFNLCFQNIAAVLWLFAPNLHECVHTHTHTESHQALRWFCVVVTVHLSVAQIYLYYAVHSSRSLVRSAASCFVIVCVCKSLLIKFDSKWGATIIQFNK